VNEKGHHTQERRSGRFGGGFPLVALIGLLALAVVAVILNWQQTLFGLAVAIVVASVLYVPCLLIGLLRFRSLREAHGWAWSFWKSSFDQISSAVG
jgi:type IV secretory pathway TrbD component